MGYYVEQIDSSFHIKPENVQKAWDAIRRWRQEERQAYPTYVDEVLRAQSFVDAMSEFALNLDLDDQGGVDGIWYDGEKYYDELEDALKCIAPFVEKGSYICMVGEEHESWKWKFEQGELMEYKGHYVYEDEE